MGSGRRGSATTTTNNNRPSYDSSAWAGQSYTSAHLPPSYTMPFGLPPPLHRTRLSHDTITATTPQQSEFAWPAEPPAPHGPPRPYAPPSGAGEDAAAIASAAAAGDASSPEALEAAATKKSQQQQLLLLPQGPPRGSLLFGLGGAVAAESLLAARSAVHRAVVEEEHLRLEYAMAALDAAGARARRHWRRVSRLSEAEVVGEEALVGVGRRRAAAGGGGGERLTGLFRDCQWKLAGNEHEGAEPGRFRPVLQPVLAPAGVAQGVGGSSPTASSSAMPGAEVSASSSMEDVGLQLARKCSRYIVDIVKTEAKGDGLADEGHGGGSGGTGEPGGDNNNDDVNDDVWGVIGPLSPAMADKGSPSGAPGKTKLATDTHDALDVVEEVSSTGESPAARAQREEEERRLVEDRVRQTLAAVAGRQDGGAGPRVDLGPGAGRWRMAVAIAAEAASGMGVSEAVVLVTPKGNRRGRLSLVDKVRKYGIGGGRLVWAAAVCVLLLRGG